MDEKEIKLSVLHANGCKYLIVPIPCGISHSSNKGCVAWDIHWSAQQLPRCTCTSSPCVLYTNTHFSLPTHLHLIILLILTSDLTIEQGWWRWVKHRNESLNIKVTSEKLNSSKNCWTESIKNPQTCFPHFLIHVESTNWYTELQNVCELLTSLVNN